MKKQPMESKKGEIEFRKKLYQQQIGKDLIFDDEFDADGIESILLDRMHKTRDQIVKLKEKNISLSPYIEIGAERCQRSLVMENDLGLNGAALDISFDMLKSCSHYQKVFEKTKAPLRICCDVNSLPILSNSIPFVFCYETLHHFPEPTPITKEIYRVISPGGCFFFDEEPYRKVLHLNLYKGKKIYSKDSLTKSKVKKIFDRFFCSSPCNEVDHGIIENEDISLKMWKKSLNHFDEKKVLLTPTRFLQSDLFNPSSFVKYLLAYLLGGGISGVCRKSGINKSNQENIYDLLICPSCRDKGIDVKLISKNDILTCAHCSDSYPIVDGVLFLLTHDKFAELYPDIFFSFKRQSKS